MTDQDRDALLRFVDGQMPQDEATAFEARLALDPELQAEAEAWSAVGDALRRDTAEIVAAADFSGFVDRVTAEIAAAPAAGPEPTPAARPSAPAEAGWDRLRAWWGRSWTLVVGSAVAAGVAALVVTRAMGPGATGAGVAGVDEGIETSAPVAVEAVRNDGNQTVLISSPAADEPGATVIWLLDDEADEGDASLTEDPI